MVFWINIFILNQLNSCKIYNNTNLIKEYKNNNLLNIFCFKNRLKTKIIDKNIELDYPYSNILWYKSFKYNQFLTQTEENNTLKEIIKNLSNIYSDSYIVIYLSQFDEFSISRVIYRYLVLTLNITNITNTETGSYIGLFTKTNDNLWDNIISNYNNINESYIYWMFDINSRYINKKRISDIGMINYSIEFLKIVYNTYLDFIKLQIDTVKIIYEIIKKILNDEIPHYDTFEEDKKILLTSLLVINNLSEIIGLNNPLLSFTDLGYKLRVFIYPLLSFKSYIVFNMLNKFLYIYEQIETDIIIKIININIYG